MKLLIDADVVLYLALATAADDTAASAFERYQGIMTDVREMHFLEECDVEMFLSSDGENFRKNQYPVYKSNRKNVVPNPAMKELKAIAMAQPRTFGSPASEADDQLLIRACDLEDQGEDWVIATVDKDLRTHPGRFYNLRSRDWLTVSPTEAYTFMIAQFVMGDSVDGIKGLKGFGPKKSGAIIHNNNSMEVNYDRAKETWQENCKEEEGWAEGFNTTCNLAYIRRSQGDCLPLDFAGMSYQDFRSLLRIRL